MPKLACVVDIETTGAESTDQIIEVGSFLVDGHGVPKHPFQCLIAPTIPIPPTASAIHHIVDEDLIHAAPWSHVQTAWFVKVHEADVMVAHNAKFEAQFLSELTAPRPWICTMKCAMRAWPDAPAFGNQALRYWRSPRGLDRRQANESHRALPDAYVTAFLFRDLLAEHSLDTLIAWSAAPAMPPRIAFGKHKGAAWSGLPTDYLEWIVHKSEMDVGTKETASAYIALRAPPPPDPRVEDPRATLYLDLAKPIIAETRLIAELNAWWLDERERRREYGIAEGTPIFAALVNLCASRKTELSSHPK